jgi:3-deoxy-manno-octulosonate cytidylyltransferase (CMP-KDO synthetase)
MPTQPAALVGVIPARIGSTRFPEKPLALIDGVPMIARVVGRALESGVFDHLIVATDDERIAATARQAGADARLTDSGIANGTLRSHAALSQWEAEVGYEARWVVNIQGDEPFVHPEQLQKLAQLIRRPGTAIATLARPKTAEDPDRTNPNRVKVVCDLNGNALYFSRSPLPSGEGPWFEHVGLYAFARGTLEALTHVHPTALEKAERLEQLRWLEHGWRISVGRTLHPTHAIDTPDDLKRIEARIASGELG